MQLSSSISNSNIMNTTQSSHKHKRLNLILGKDKVQKLKTLTILLVGVGGIGCQVLKNLTKFPIKSITIIDFDTIQVSNLNRQFYFHTKDVGRAKAIVAQQQINKLLLTQIDIKSIYGSIYDNEYYNYTFYQQFDVVISALDSLQAREFLAKKCTEYGKVLIDAGTAGYHGQAYTSVRFLTGCHNCYNVDKINQHQRNDLTNIAVCTIRSRPSKTAHCAIYAKYIFQQIFSTNHVVDQNNYHNNNNNKSQLARIRQKIDECLSLIDQQRQLSKSSQQKILRIGTQLFDYLFCQQFYHVIDQNQGKQEEQNKLRINLLKYKDVVINDDVVNIQQKQKAIQQLSQQIQILENNELTIKQYAQLFIYSFVKLIQQIVQSQKITIIYDKDEFYCNLFIYSLTNLRVYNFLFYKEKQVGLKYISFYQVRKMIGKIVPAIASTNSIAAALQVKQILQLVYIRQKQQNSIQNSLKNDELKYYTISPFTQKKLSYSWLSLPNPQCTVCSPLNLYYHIKCNFNKTTFQQLQKFTYEKCFSYQRDVYCQNLILVKNMNVKKQSANKKKLLNFKPQLLIKDTLAVQYFPVKEVTDLKVKITIVHQQQLHQGGQNMNVFLQKFKIINEKQIKQTLKALQIFRQKQKQRQQQKHNQKQNQLLLLTHKHNKQNNLKTQQQQQKQQYDQQPFIEIE